MDYHWDNREKIKNDYKLINKIYEKYLDVLTNELNNYHKTNFSKKYWRIILGPWLGSILCKVFDSWTSMKNAKLNYKNLYLIFTNIKLEEIVPSNTVDYYSKMNTDSWNKNLFQIIAEEINLNIEYKDIFSESKLVNKKDNNKVQKLIRSFIDNFLGIQKIIKKFIMRILIAILSINRTKKNKIVIFSLYLNFISCLRLIIKDKRIIMPDFDKSIKDRNLDLKFRQKRLSYKKQNFYNFETDFISFCAKILPLLIPKIFLENYKEALKINSNNYLKNVNSIMTANGIYAEEIFKFYAADSVEKGRKLYIFQHGGNYAMGKFSFFDDHEYLICDKFLSWGWDYDKRKKIIPFGSLNLYSKRKNIKIYPKNGILLILMSLPKYSYYVCSRPISSIQIKSYHFDQFKFIESLPEKILKNIEVKLHPKDFGFNIRKEWNIRFPNVKVLNQKVDATSLLSKYRVFVITYNATTFLALLYYNVPTIAFWDEHTWETNKFSQSYLNLLKKVNIIHSSPESAAKFLSDNYEIINEWWYSKETQKANKLFCDKFAKVSENTLNKISKLV